MITRRSSLVYGTLLAIWIILIAWQAAEHSRVKQSARAALRDRAKEFSNAMGVVMRSQQRRYNWPVFRGPFETALNELMSSGELRSVVLFNAEEGIVASAGAPIDPQIRIPAGGELWGEQTAMFENLVDLGTNIVVLPGSPARPNTNSPAGDLPPPPPITESTTNSASTNLTGQAGRPRRNRPRDNLTDEARRELRQKGGVHSFLIAMSTDDVRAVTRQDLWLRMIIGILGTMSVAGYGLAWRSFGNTSDLQIRLARASELNSHLKEMNLAAAGLAHETRNPLNIIRGLAQMISKQQDASPETRGKSRDIIDEADRVAAQLNEFINYSRPRELRRVPTNLSSVVGEVVHALNYDIEEKKVQVQSQVDKFMIEADEQLLRQALFNLVLNAIQAVPEKGEIVIRSGKRNGSGAFIEIADNGPGVALEHRAEIFKPYFTTHQKGTGLGLAVVQQIVAAHGWEIECEPNPPAGALFRISRVKVIVKS